MKNVIKRIFIILILVGLIIGGLFIYKEFFMKDDDGGSKRKPIVEEAKELDTIEGFSYILYDNSTELYKDLYYELKEVLESEEIDYKLYAEVISKMFVADFYTLNNKVTNQNVGGLDFVHSKIKDNFKTKATETLYKHIETNVYGDRTQKLPEVSGFNSCVATLTPYTYTNKEDGISINDPNGYVVKISWNYKEDLGYQKSATIRLVHEDKYLTIVSVN